MKAIGYCRVSSEEQAREGVSLAAQEAKIRAYADLLDLELVGVIVDAGKSAKTMNRDGLQEIMRLVEAGEVQTVIVYKLDRLSRRVVDTLHLIERIEAAGAAFHSIQEKVDTKSAIGKFFLTITAAFAQMERDLISERTIECLSHKKAVGEHVGGVPYGHRVEGRKLVISETGAAILTIARTMREQGATLQNIADTLNAQGVATQRSGKWHPCTVRNLLRRAV